MNLSTNTIIVAMQAVDAEIKRCEGLAKAGGLGDAEVEANRQYILDDAGFERLGIHEQARKGTPACLPRGPK
jgi:hypothetical protein